MGKRDRNLLIAGLAGAALADSVYLKLYEEGVVRKVWCPLAGEGCARVLRSPQSKTWGISHTTAGLAGAAAMAGLAMWQARRPSQRKQRALQAMAVGASAASLYLAWVQKAKVGAWCSLCLGAEAINLATLPLAFD